MLRIRRELLSLEIPNDLYGLDFELKGSLGCEFGLPNSRLGLRASKTMDNPRQWRIRWVRASPKIGVF